MAPKRSEEDDPKENPQPAADGLYSSDEDDAESSSEGTPPPPHPRPVVLKPKTSSSDHCGSESDTSPEQVFKPLVSKPILKSPKSKHAVTPTLRKRLSEAELEETGSKHARSTSEKAGHRVWSDGDGVVVLKGMLDFQEKNGTNPNSDLNKFYEFIKDSVSPGVSKTQLSDKIRHLRSKYMANQKKMRKSGSVNWVKPIDKELFEWSKNVWGESNGSHAAKAIEHQPKSSNMKAKKTKSHGTSTPVPPEAEAMPIDKKTIILKRTIGNHLSDNKHWTENMMEFVMKEGLDLVEKSKRAKLEERWVNLHKAELELYVARTKFVYDQSNIIYEAHK